MDTSVVPVRVRGPRNPVDSHLRLLHHYESRIRRKNGIARQPQSPFQTYVHDGTRLWTHCRGKPIDIYIREVDSARNRNAQLLMTNSCIYIYTGHPLLGRFRKFQNIGSKNDANVQTLLGAALPTSRFWVCSHVTDQYIISTYLFSHINDMNFDNF